MSAKTVRRAMILPVILFVLILLGLLAAVFSLRVNADLAATRAQTDMFQSRLAAEAGIERVKMLLRADRFDTNRWYNNPDELHRVIVWCEGGDTTLLGKNEELDEGTPAFRFSIVADDPSDDDHFIRFGITDEASKLNVNKATAAQLLALVSQAVEGDESVDPKAIVDAILDWRDSDQDPSGEDADTEGDYYESLDKPYRVKNGPLDTVEELLLVKGISGSVFYGEDFDRNGLLTPNEDDGDQTFPPDNQDSRLNRGLYPYLTAVSAEDNVSNDRRQRVSLSGNQNAIREQLKNDFPDDPEVVEFLATAVRGQTARPGTDRPSGRQQGVGAGQRNRPAVHGPGGQRRGGAPTPPAAAGDKSSPQKRERQTQPKPKKPVPSGVKPPKDGSADEAEIPPVNPEGENPETGENPPGTGDPQAGDAQGQPKDPAQPGQPNSGQPGETGQAQGAQQPIRSPASLLLLEGKTASGGQPQPNPLRLEHLPILMDRTTILRQDAGPVVGLININTAPQQVLKCLEGLTETDIESIIAKRETLDSTVKSNTAWLVTEEAITLETFDKIAAQITARGQQFLIESLGYADHLGTVTRLQVIVDLMGPVPQTVYYRDATYVGGHFPIREKDKERIRVR